MKYLNDIREDVRRLLSDKFVSGTTQSYEDDELDQHIEAALAELSLVVTRKFKYSVESDGSKKITLVDDTDQSFELAKLIRVIKAEYEIDQDPEEFRNVTRFGDTLTLDITTAPASGDTIYLYCDMIHTLTDDNSSLTPALEALLITGAAGYAAAAKATNYFNQANKAISDFSTIETAISGVSDHISDAIDALEDGHSDLSEITSSVSDAETELAKVAAEVAQAISDLDSGRSLITGIDNAKAATGYVNYAQAGINNALGYVRSAGEFVNGANVKGAVSSIEMREGSEYLTAANVQLNIANGYITNTRLKLSLVNVGTAFTSWGNSKIADFRNRLKRMAGHRSSLVYSPN